MGNYTMSYYKLKCVNCGYAMRSEDVVFRLATEEFEQDTNAILRGESSAAPLSLQMDGMAAESRDLTYRELTELAGSPEQGGSARVFPIWEMVPMNEEVDLNQVLVGNLMTGVEIRGLKHGGQTLNGLNRRRRCPMCKRLLSQYSGKMPTYTLGVLGHSSAGKTVYFTVLHDRLRNSINVPGGVLSSMIDVSHLEKGERVDFDGMAGNIYGPARHLPNTTQNAINQPYCRVFTYRRDGEQDYTTRCLLSVRDVMGELFVRDANDRDRDMLAATTLCNQADGILMVVDPLAMRLPRERLAEEDRLNQEAGSWELRNMETVVRAQISPGSAVKKPSVVMMAKSDILLRRSSILEISPDNPIVAGGFTDPIGNPEVNWFEDFMMPLDRDTRQCLHYLDGWDNGDGFYHFLMEKFNNAFYTAVSSLGSKVTISKGESGMVEIDNSDLIQPRFVEVPILYLLMRFHILPPLFDGSYYQQPEQRYKEWYQAYAQRKER